MRKDIFDRVVAFKENVGVEGLSSEQKRLVDKLILHGRRNGKMMIAKRLICDFYMCSKLNANIITLCIFISSFLLLLLSSFTSSFFFFIPHRFSSLFLIFFLFFSFFFRFYCLAQCLSLYLSWCLCIF